MPWTPGPDGPARTHIANLHPPDRRHHQLHTHFGWTPAIDAGTAQVTWTSPMGQTATSDADDWGPVGASDPPQQAPPLADADLPF